MMHLAGVISKASGIGRLRREDEHRHDSVTALVLHELALDQFFRLRGRHYKVNLRVRGTVVDNRTSGK